MIAMSGELPADTVFRLGGSSRYKEKLITTLKKSGGIKAHYKDKLRGYRLTSKTKKQLLLSNPERYNFYLTGSVDTNRIQSGVTRRLRLHRIAGALVTMYNAGVRIYRDEKSDVFSSQNGNKIEIAEPCFYTSREFKNISADMVKVKNARAVGILMTGTEIFMAYNTENHVMKWDYKSELDMKAVISRFTHGTILGQLDGKVVYVPEKSRMNRNIAVYGASGSMKPRAFARNMVLQCVKRGESLIVTDPKSELYEDMSEYLRQNGYTVKVFNLISPENSDSWNCLNEIEGQEIMAQLFADVIIKNTSSGKPDHFWDNSELNLLKALVLFVEQGYPEKDKNIGEAYKLLTLNSEKELNSLFDALPIGHPAKAPYSIFKQAAETVRGGIIIGLGSRLQVFQNSLIRSITAHNEIDLTLPGRQKCCYFCITSDQDSTFDFLSSLFLSFLFIKLVRYADRQGHAGGLPVAVHILADELANIGVIPDLTKKISTIRSRNISMSVIFQNLAQMQNRYPQNQWQEIIGNCDVQLFLGCTDEITAKFISDRTGEVTIGVNSRMKNLNTWRVSNYTHEYRETSSIGKRKLLTPD